MSALRPRLRAGIVGVATLALIAVAAGATFAASNPPTLYACFDVYGNVRMTDVNTCKLPGGGRLVSWSTVSVPGPQGPQGPQGMPGPVGARGPTGPAGADGSGISGDSGTVAVGEEASLASDVDFAVVLRCTADNAGRLVITNAGASDLTAVELYFDGHLNPTTSLYWSTVQPGETWRTLPFPGWVEVQLESASGGTAWVSLSLLNGPSGCYYIVHRAIG
jgi:hypothetical protein